MKTATTYPSTTAASGRLLAALAAFGLLSQSALLAAPPADQQARLEFFEKKIRPVLAGKCYECHSEKEGKSKGELTLDTRDGTRSGGAGGPAVVPGDADSSNLIRALKYETNLKMPPAKHGGKLSDEVIADFVAWVKMGALDPRDSLVKTEPGRPEKEIDWAKERQFWAFKKPEAVAAPKVNDGKWPKTDVDRFVLAKLEEKGLHPVADAEKPALLRRVHFDLVGLPPTPAEVDAFVKDRSANAFEKVVERLLASPQFGERWGRHWLDVARYGESSGKDRNITFPYAWKYRDYVIDSFNEDKPFDRFIQEQIAGDLLSAKDQKEKDRNRIATGFLAVGPKGLNETRPKNFKWDVIDDQIDTTSRAILGLTVACARCHDHKFDPVTARDYHALGGIFASTDTRYGTIGGGGNRRPSTLLALNGAPEQSIQVFRAPAPNVVAGTNAAANATSNAVNPNRARRLAARAAAANASGTAATNAVQDLAAAPAIQSTNATTALETNLLAGVARTNVPARNRFPRKPEHGDYAMGVQEGTPTDATIFFRGEIDKPRDIVPRGVIRILSWDNAPVIPADMSGRLQLAEWLSSPENPLTARVFVNRAWQQLFGAGLVETPDNFGKLGIAPTHPELLDHLAVKWSHEQRWSVKQLVRSLVLTRTYQLGTQIDPKALEVDAGNALLWRSSPRRLDAEALRDAVLAVSGRLDLKPLNTSVTAAIGNGYIGANVKDTEFNVELTKRSVYLPIVRDLVPESLALFDFPDPNLVGAKRENTSAPTQSLFLLNNGFVQKESQQFARRLLDGKRLTESGRIRDAYLTAFSRPPTDAEIKRAKAFIDRQTRLLSTPAALAKANPPAPAVPATGATAAETNLVAVGNGGFSEFTSKPAPTPEAPRPTTPRELAWANFAHALIGSAEFRFLY